MQTISRAAGSVMTSRLLPNSSRCYAEAKARGDTQMVKKLERELKIRGERNKQKRGGPRVGPAIILIDPVVSSEYCHALVQSGVEDLPASCTQA